MKKHDEFPQDVQVLIKKWESLAEVADAALEAVVEAVAERLDPQAVRATNPNGCGIADCPRHGDAHFYARMGERCKYPIQRLAVDRVKERLIR